MQKFVFGLWVFALAILAACGGNAQAHSDTLADNQLSADFLRAHGVPADSITLFSDGHPFWLLEEDDTLIYQLSNHQLVDLLGEWLGLTYEQIDEYGSDGNYTVRGYKPMAGGRTLVAFGVEYGDGGSLVVALYDRNGQLTDAYEAGYCHDYLDVEMADDFTHGILNTVTTVCSADGDSALTMRRTEDCHGWKANGVDDLPHRQRTADIWKIDRTIRLRIDDKGHFVADNPVPEPALTGEVPRLALALDNVACVAMLPTSDNYALDQLNELARRYKGNNELFDDDSREAVAQSIRYALGGRFDHNPQQVLQWMAKYREHDNNHLIKLFEELFLYQITPKEQLVEAINAMTDPDARQYLQRLTAQWGPINAKG